MGKKAAGRKVGRDAVKRCLQQYHMAKQKKRILEERRRTLSAELREPSVSTAYAVPAANIQPDGWDTVVQQTAEVEMRIAKQQAEMAKAVQNVMDLIDLLPVGSMERTVVELRHIDSKAWEGIAKTVHMSRSRVIDYYNAALDALAGHDKAAELVRR